MEDMVCMPHKGGLNGVGLDHARIGEGDILHLLQPLDVAFDHLAPG